MICRQYFFFFACSYPFIFACFISIGVLKKSFAHFIIQAQKYPEEEWLLVFLAVVIARKHASNV
jgi:hypothetical protein